MCDRRMGLMNQRSTMVGRISFVVSQATTFDKEEKLYADISRRMAING
jgi:hypothetical protein